MKQCTNLKSIHIRPAAADGRNQVGHWEGDLLLGAFHGSAVATLVDRKTRHTLLIPIHGRHSAKNLADTLVKVFNQLPSALRRTLTWDQGNEMFQHERIETETGLKVYFADPHSPWQRATNENTNGLLRQYFPKGTNFHHITNERLQEVAIELNDRPRACLQDRKPAQLMTRWKPRHITS